MCPRDATNKIMSVAICFNCGSFKFGAFCSCEKCGALQESEDGSAITHLLNRLENQVSNQPSLARCQATLRTEFESTLSTSKICPLLLFDTLNHVTMKTLLFAILFGTVMLSASANEPKFEKLEVSLHEDPSVRFIFSAADASSSSPVIISVPGRALTKKDRVHRVDLQKHWLSIHVPKNLTFRIRTLVECEYTREGEFSGADHYVFEDDSGHEFHYYFYVGNWP